MMHTGRKDQSGMSLVETTIALAVLILGMGSAYSLLSVGTSQAKTSNEVLVGDTATIVPLQILADLVTESSASYIDTTMRYHYSDFEISYSSDRFAIAGLSQCMSPICRWHTNSGNSREEHLHFAHENRGLNLTDYTRGKVIPGEAETCPFDGSQLASFGYMDVLRVFSARDSQGKFHVDSSGRALWQKAVFVAPIPDDNGTCSLVKFEVHVSELVAGGVVASGGWDRWPADSPSLIQLFDFGLDGTTNGEPDARVPTTPDQADSHDDAFFISTHNSNTSLYLYKRLNNPGEYPHRLVVMDYNLVTGELNFSARHHDSPTETWETTTSLVRKPEVLLRGVTEFVCSTASSNPNVLGAAAPGVESPSIVRIGLGTSHQIVDKGERRWLHDTRMIQVAARNR
jgi:hypothetical protein